jgi:predicted phage terminase large subunit-like protein
MTRYIPPNPATGGPRYDQHPTQQAFLLTDHIQEVFFGGAAGGGKSDALLMAALQYVDHPRYNAILFRRSYADLSLPGALLDRARDWLGQTDAKWNDREHTWTFPNPNYDATIYKDGASLTFAYLQTERQKHRYASADFQFIGFDELTTFSETMYRFLFSRLRKDVDTPVPLRMRSASNPGNIGHAWVRARFVTPGIPDALFIPSKVQDNPSLNIAEYLKALAQLDPLTRARLLAGNWDIRDEGMFKGAWFKLLEATPTQQLQRVRYWDLAATEENEDNDPDYTVGALLGLDRRTRMLYMLDQRRARVGPQGVEALVRSTAQLDGIDVPVRIEQEPGAGGKSLISYYTRHVLQGFDVKGIPSTTSKETRAAPFASQAEAGNIYVVNGAWVKDFIEEAEGFPMVEHDDQIDAWSGAFHQLMRDAKVTSESYIKRPEAEVIRRGDLVLKGARYRDRE